MRTRQLSERQYVILLALLCGLILAVGSWLRPEDLPEPIPSAAEASRLQALAQRSRLEDQAAYFSGIAAGIQPRLLWLEETRTSGLVWGPDGSIVTAGPKAPVLGALTGVGSQGEIALEPDILSSSFAVAVLKAPAGVALAPPQRGSAARLVPGMWILQVGRQTGGVPLFTPGIYGGVVTVQCGRTEYRAVQSSIPLSESARGSGLFDLDGNLLALVTSCGSGYAAITPEEVGAVIDRARSLEGRLLRLYGLRVAALGDLTRGYFGVEEGVWVSEVLLEMRADAAGLRPGDVVVAMDNRPVASSADLSPLLSASADAVFDLQVRRNRRPVRVSLPGSLTTREALSGMPAAGIGLASPAAGPVIEAVAAGSAADRASLAPGDQVISIGGQEPRNAEAARAALAEPAGEPLFVVIQRDSRRLGVFLQ